MTIFCTYCTGNKNQSANTMRTLDLYISNRIASTHIAATSLGLPFYILSGKYGLVDAEQHISHYDQRLSQEAVAKHAHTLAKQIQHIGINKIVFFHLPTSIDKYNKAYIDCMIFATKLSNIDLSLIEITIPE